MIRLGQATVRYGSRVVLKEADFHLGEGRFAYMTGKSGSGKSTLIRLVSREISHSGGEVLVAGRSVAAWKKHELRRRIGVVYQSFELLDRHTIAQNMAFAAMVRGVEASEARRETDRLLERVGLAGRGNELPRSLSGGEQQRAAVARALIGRPTMVLADEPTGNLDGDTAAGIMALLRELQGEEGLTMLVVTHDRGLMARYPGEVWEIAEGSIGRHE